MGDSFKTMMQSSHVLVLGGINTYLYDGPCVFSIINLPCRKSSFSKPSALQSNGLPLFRSAKVIEYANRWGRLKSHIATSYVQRPALAQEHEPSRVHVYLRVKSDTQACHDLFCFSDINTCLRNRSSLFPFINPSYREFISKNREPYKLCSVPPLLPRPKNSSPHSHGECCKFSPHGTMSGVSLIRERKCQDINVEFWFRSQRDMDTWSVLAFKYIKSRFQAVSSLLFITLLCS